ncbi:hypothetical protein CPB85DRAFT_1258518 [Mucidula mucida]|nr:hypothetical protein CPB85DRAFT_1258518 [Mucidula mucida]
MKKLSYILDSEPPWYPSQRFDKIGTLSARGEWVIQASPQQSKVYSSGTEYWIAHATRRLATIFEEARYNAVRTHVDGFPLIFHSQNIFVVDADSDEPRISSAVLHGDHPMDDLDDEKTQVKSRRKARDREVYTRLMEEEVRRFPNRPPKLSQALLKWEGVYLFEQCIDGGVFYSALWNTLVEHVVGDQKDAQMEYFFAMIESGILKSVRRIWRGGRNSVIET